MQRPHPPLLLGGGGRRVLSIAAREADIVGINGNLAAGTIGPEAVATMTHGAVVEKVAVVREAAGDRLAEIELNIRVFMVQVTDDAGGQVGGIAGMLRVEESTIAESPFALIGSVPAIVDTLQQRREQLGISYVVVGGDVIDAFAPVVAELAGT